MLYQFARCIVFAIGFSFLSCHSGQDKKIEIPNAEKGTENEFSLLENKLALDSLNIKLRTTLALNYYSAGDLNKAGYHFQKIYSLDPNNLAALSNLGNIYYDSQQDDKAIVFYEKALETDSANINMRCDLATCYANINKMKKAIEILREKIRRNVTHAKSHYNLSVILQKNGNMKEAEAEMRIYKSLTSGTK